MREDTIKVMVVDDVDDQGELIATAVNHEGDMRCLRVFQHAGRLLQHLADIERANGRAAETLRQCDDWPDVLVIDWMMPEISGQLALELIARRWPFVRMIVFTAVSSDEVTDLAHEAGAAAVVRKTQGVINLIATIREICDRAECSHSV